MKKLVVMAAVVAATASINSVVIAKPIEKNKTVIVNDDWKKSKEGTWAGKDKTWYKIDEKANLWWSKDGKKWEASKDGMWQDKEGKWLKIDNKMLKWSADGGKTWGEVPEWKWEGEDGTWNKFDKDWSLWTMKGKM
jgi:hypothetical protein